MTSGGVADRHSPLLPFQFIRTFGVKAQRNNPMYLCLWVRVCVCVCVHYIYICVPRYCNIPTKNRTVADINIETDRIHGISLTCRSECWQLSVQSVGERLHDLCFKPEHCTYWPLIYADHLKVMRPKSVRANIGFYCLMTWVWEQTSLRMRQVMWQVMIHVIVHT